MIVFLFWLSSQDNQFYFDKSIQIMKISIKDIYFDSKIILSIS